MLDGLVSTTAARPSYPIKYLSPDGRGVLLAAQGHQHGVIVGAVGLEDILGVLAVHLEPIL